MISVLIVETSSQRQRFAIDCATKGYASMPSLFVDSRWIRFIDIRDINHETDDILTSLKYILWSTMFTGYSMLEMLFYRVMNQGLNAYTPLSCNRVFTLLQLHCRTELVFSCLISKNSPLWTCRKALAGYSMRKNTVGFHFSQLELNGIPGVCDMTATLCSQVTVITNEAVNPLENFRWFPS